MKIFLCFFQSQQKHPIPAYDFWEYYLKNGIEEACHQWEECPDVDWALGLVPQSPQAFLRWKQDAWGKTVSYLKKHPADVVLSYLYPQQIEASAIKEVQKTGIPWVNFYCDHIRDFKTLPSEFSVFDLNWVPEYEALNLYKKARFNSIHLPMPMWVDPSLRVLKDEQYRQITFIGSKDIQRLTLLNDIVKLNPDIPLAIFGTGWIADSGERPSPNVPVISKASNQLRFIHQHGMVAFFRKMSQRVYEQPIGTALNQKMGKKLSFGEYTSLTAQSWVTMGINRYPSFHYPFKSPNVYSRLRDIEAPMLGACYLTEWAPGMEELYDTNTEIRTYSSAAEFMAQSEMLMGERAKRLTLKANAQKRALATHSIPISLQRLICTLGL